MLRGEVTAVELHAGRARELEENVRRLGATNVRVVNADVRELAESGFDRALVDAPCSGLGVLGAPPRPPLARASRCPELQLELLRAAAERTSPGGTVVYSVCTLNADENEAVVDASAASSRSRSARSGRSSPTRSGRSSCSRRRTATARRVLHRAAPSVMPDSGG